MLVSIVGVVALAKQTHMLAQYENEAVTCIVQTIVYSEQIPPDSFRVDSKNVKSRLDDELKTYGDYRLLVAPVIQKMQITFLSKHCRD